MNFVRIAGTGFVLTMLAAVGCGGAGPAPSSDLVEQILQLDAEEALALANEWRTTKPEVTSTLRTDAVHFALPDGREASVLLPGDTMALAVAPYVTTTHSCAIHSMSGCSGELAGVEMRVIATTADGMVLLDEIMTAMGNGYIELWLPRDSEIDVTIQAEGREAVGTVTTYDDSPTCIVNLRLE